MQSVMCHVRSCVCHVWLTADLLNASFLCGSNAVPPSTIHFLYMLNEIIKKQRVCKTDYSLDTNQWCSSSAVIGERKNKGGYGTRCELVSQHGDEWMGYSSECVRKENDDYCAKHSTIINIPVWILMDLCPSSVF